MSEQMLLQQRLVELFLEKLTLAVPSVDTDLFATGVLDSLSLVNLLLELENEFDMKVSLEDLNLDNFRSIASIARFILRDRQRKSAVNEPMSPDVVGGNRSIQRR